VIIKARIPFGIVRPATRRVPEPKREKGDQSSKSWQEIQKYPQTMITNKEAETKYRQSDHGRIVKKEYRAARRKQKITKDQATTITSLGGVTGEEIAKHVMNLQQPKMGLSSVLDYANNIGGVYIWYTERDDVHGCDYESTRFITHGQSTLGKGNHNAVLMRNPRSVQFPQNICPYQERFNHGFTSITKTDCCDFGIEYCNAC
jgi:hypothetical protein